MDHKYAQYSLAGLYRRGRGVEQNDMRAFSLYRSSAEQGNPYASLELAKMYRDGLGTEPDPKLAERGFQDAYSGFVILEEKSHDDKLQYRIGQMLHTGTPLPFHDLQSLRCFQCTAAAQIYRFICYHSAAYFNFFTSSTASSTIAVFPFRISSTTQVSICSFRIA